MWSAEVIKALPLVEFGFQIDIALVGEELVELLFIGSMRSLDLAVQLRCSASNVGVSDALIFDVPVELRLEFMTVVGPDLFDAERELLDDMVDEIDRAGLCVLLVDFERPNAGRIIDGRELEATDFLACIISKRQKLHVHLDVMAGNLLVVALCVDLPHTGAARQAIDTVSPQDTRYSRVRDFDAVIARQVPDDPHWTEVVFASEMKNLFLDLDRRAVGMPLRDRRLVGQSILAACSIGVTPTVKAAATNAEISAGLGDVARLLSVLQDTQLTCDLSSILAHEHLLHPSIGS